ncbi:MAG: phage tail protein [Myxococcales bacterium]|nr:phage tail protein [Myxococcales bacterium]
MSSGQIGGKRLRFGGADPYVNFYFKLEIQGITVAHFQEVSGLSHTTKVEPFNEGGENFKVHKLMGQTECGNITCKNGISDSMALWNWRKQITTNRITLRKNGYIVLLGENQKELARWEFTRGWPSKWEGPTFDGKGNALAIETVEIACEELKRIK